MSWNELSLKDKADYIKESVNNGIYNLSDIRNRYNMYAEGGYKPSESIKKRITNWEGSSMRTNRSFQAEANDFNRVIPSSIRSKLSQQQLDALYSYGYNVGMGNLKKRVLPTLTNYVQGKASNEDVQKSMWASKDNELRGLTTRRNIERSLFGGKYQTVFTGTGGTPHNYGYIASTTNRSSSNPYQIQNEEWQSKNYLDAYKGLQLSMNDIMGKTKEDDIDNLFSPGTGPIISMENLLSIGNNTVAPVQPDYSYAKSLLSDFDSDLNSNMFAEGGNKARHGTAIPYKRIHINKDGTFTDTLTGKVYNTSATNGEDVVITGKANHWKEAGKRNINSYSPYSSIKQIAKDYLYKKLDNWVYNNVLEPNNYDINKIRRTLYNKLDPFGYEKKDSLGNVVISPDQKIKTALNPKTPNRDFLKDDVVIMRNPIYAKYLGLKDYYNGYSMVNTDDNLNISNYFPTIGNKGNVYYKSPTESDSYWGPFSDAVLARAFKTRDNKGKNTFVSPHYDNVMGHYTTSFGKDKKGKYISYYDIWDLNPFKGTPIENGDIGERYGIGKPVHLYNRKYYTNADSTRIMNKYNRLHHLSLGGRITFRKGGNMDNNRDSNNLYISPFKKSFDEGGPMDSQNDNTNLVFIDADNRRSNILLHTEDGNLYDSAGNNYTQNYLDEENVPIIKGTMPRNTRQYYDPNTTLEFINAATAPISNFSPSNIVGSIREAKDYNTFINSFMNQDNTGFFTREYAKEHPYISTLGNLGGDILLPNIGGKTAISMYRLRPSNLRKHIFENISPIGYEEPISRIKEAFKSALSGAEADIDNPSWFNRSSAYDLDNYNTANINKFHEHALEARFDAWRKYLGLPQKFNTWTKSPIVKGAYTDKKGISKLKSLPFNQSTDFVNSAGGNVANEIEEFATRGVRGQKYGVSHIRDTWDLQPWSRLEGNIIENKVIRPLYNNTIGKVNIKLSNALNNFINKYGYDNEAIQKYLNEGGEEALDNLPDVIEYFVDTKSIKGKLAQKLSGLNNVLTNKAYYTINKDNKLSKLTNKLSNKIKNFETSSLLPGAKPFKIAYDIPWTNKVFPNNEMIKGFDLLDTLPTEAHRYKLQFPKLDYTLGI